MSPAQGQIEAASGLRGTGDDPPALEQDDVIVLLEAGSSLEATDERGVERERGHDRPANASHGPNDVDTAGHGQAAGLADPKAARRLNGEIGASLQHPRERSPVSLEESALECPVACELAGRGVGRRDRLLIRGQCRPETGLQACVDTPRLAPRCNR